MYDPVVIVIGVLFAFVFFIGFLLLLRQLILWYYRVNDIVDRLDQMLGYMKEVVLYTREKRCPYCAEHIDPEAKTCRHCGREIPVIEPKIEKPSPVSSPPAGAVQVNWICPNCKESCHPAWYRCPECGYRRKDEGN